MLDNVRKTYNNRSGCMIFISSWPFYSDGSDYFGSYRNFSLVCVEGERGKGKVSKVLEGDDYNDGLGI